MKDYLLKRENKKRKIVKLSLPLEGISLKPKLKPHKSLITVKEILVIQPESQKIVVMKKFDKMYRRLIAIMIDVTESTDATTADCTIALNEIAKVRDMIEREKEKILKQMEYETLLKKLAMVEGKIQNKMLEIRTNEMLKNMVNVPFYEEERGKSR